MWVISYKKILLFLELISVNRNILKKLAYTYIERRDDVYMEYAKDDIFEIRYNESQDILEIGEKSWTSKLKNKIKNHKLFSTIVMVLAVFSIINIIMIYNFMNILQNI